MLGEKACSTLHECNSFGLLPQVYCEGKTLKGIHPLFYLLLLYNLCFTLWISRQVASQKERSVDVFVDLLFLAKMKNNLMKWIIFKKRKKIDWISKPNFLSIPLWLLLVKPFSALENKIKLLLFTSAPQHDGVFCGPQLQTGKSILHISLVVNVK